jgi:hypothetical protein
VTLALFLGLGQVPMPERKAVTRLEAALAECTISTFSFMDDEALVKLHIPIAGAASLPAGCIRCDFRDRSFDLRVRARPSASPAGRACCPTKEFTLAPLRRRGHWSQLDITECAGRKTIPICWLLLTIGQALTRARVSFI